MRTYWDKVWLNSEVNVYKKYINLDMDYEFIKIFKENKIENVCDAACGFGKYSVILGHNDFLVSGFDIAYDSINLTLSMLKDFNISYKEYLACSLTDIKFKDEEFDATLVHAAIDHLSYAEAKLALKELIRITKINGLIYVTFDGIDEEDERLKHEVLEDGSFKYLDEARKDMIFRYYTDEDIHKFLVGKEIIYFNKKQNGEREVILKKV